MQISNLKESDILKFSRLAKQIIVDSPYYSDSAKTGCLHDFHTKKIKADLKDRNMILIAAKNNEKIIGFMRGFFDGGISSGIFWLQWIGVDAEYQRSGVAEKMLEYLTKKLKNHYHAHKIVCVIRPPNNASIALFKKNKYQKLTLLKKHWYKEDFLLWYKYI